MTRFSVMTLFPEMIEAGVNVSILARAAANELLDIRAVNIRDYTDNKHGRVDDYTYGGGAGMLMQAQPIYDCYQALVDEQPADRVIYLTPQGRTFDQDMACELAGEKHIVFLCGHYEGVDERVLEAIVTDYVSIGDYVLTGGELPAMVMIDAISRHIPGVLHNEDSTDAESFSDGLLEYPQYTRPEEWMGKKVPGILLSGDHAKVDVWRHNESLKRTKSRRPDLYDAYVASHPEETFQ